MTAGIDYPGLADTGATSLCTPLDYTQLRARRTSRQQWCLAIKVAAIGVVATGVFGVGVYSGKIARESSPTLFGPGAAVASHELSAGLIVYEELPTAARELLLDSAYINPLARRAPVAIHSSRHTRQTYQMLTRAKTVNTVTDHGAQTLLTELQTVNGRPRIVSVRYIPAGTNAQVAGFLIETFDLTGFLARPKRVYQAFVADVVRAMPADGTDARDFRLFAGQAETDEAGHFTIPYEIGNQRGIIDGYLRPDGRTVNIELRDQAIRRMLQANPVHMPVSNRTTVASRS